MNAQTIRDNLANAHALEGQAREHRREAGRLLAEALDDAERYEALLAELGIDRESAAVLVRMATGSEHAA